MLRENDVLLSVSHPSQLSQSHDASTTNTSVYYSTSSGSNGSFYSNSMNNNFTTLTNQGIPRNDNNNASLPNMSTFYSRETNFLPMSGK